jgi:hypothetical protein
MNQADDDAVTRLVEAANPAPGTVRNSDVDNVWARIEADLDSVRIVAGRSRRHRLAIMGVAVAAAAALTAAAPFVATKSGVWTTAESTPAGGPGQEYRLNGSDFAVELAKLGSDIPYPDEASRNRILTNVVANLSGTDAKDDVATTGALRAELARGAICAWTHTWQAADAAHDKNKRTASTKALTGAVKWPAVTDVDPQPAIDGEVDAGAKYPTVFGYLPGIADAANQGRAKLLASRTEESGYCTYWDGNTTSPEATAPVSQPTETGEAVATTPPNPTETEAVATTPPSPTAKRSRWHGHHPQ